ncbi:MAG: AAA family ATPase [Xanthomonadaceae bacterium]|nr:AAA family ATPase [Xanthomonadaceae bacterium]
MYTGHFGLSGRPFAITPDPRYLYLSERHREALAHLLYGVTESGGFIQLTGEVGTGKTTLTRTLLAQLPPHVDAALVYNPRASLTEFLEMICDELHVERPPGAASPKALTDALNRHLLAAHERGRRTVLIVDEAQNLAPDLLEQVRLLTNLETHTEKLLQILLIGQPELRETLARTELRQIAQRITARYHLEPLDEAETAAYVRHRLEVAGAPRPLFTKSALRALHRHAGGVPRLINIICDRALLGAYAEGAREVDAGLVRHAAHEVRGELPRHGRGALIAVASGAAVAAVAGALWFSQGFDFSREPAAAVQASVDVTPSAEPDVVLPATEPEPDPLPTLDELLAGGDDLAAASAHLLALWDGGEAGAGLPATLCEHAAETGLACVRGRGTWNNLRVLGRPALLELRSAGETHTVLLTGLSERDATLWLNGAEHAVPLLDLDRAWLGEYLLLWRPPLSSGVLGPGSLGNSVVALREALALWGEDTGDAAQPAFFDAGLEASVRTFQRALALNVDGIAGEQTLIHLDGLTTTAGPRLDVPDS